MFISCKNEINILKKKKKIDLKIDFLPSKKPIMFE